MPPGLSFHSQVISYLKSRSTLFKVLVDKIPVNTTAWSPERGPGKDSPTEHRAGRAPVQTTGQAELTLSGGSSLLAGTAQLVQGTGGARSRRGTNETYAPRGAEPTLQRSVLTECTHNFPVVCRYPVPRSYMVGSSHGDQVLFFKFLVVFYFERD